MSDGPQVSKEEQNWAMYCHLAALAGFVVPLGNVLGPLIVWLIKKDTMPLVDQHGKEALNFQITVLIAFIISALLTLVLIGFLLLFVVGIGALVLTIMAAVKVSNGQLDYKYPFALRLIK
ncbi:MAG: orotate phosphoribosyltransferase [Betaproteobacteria bacterium RIFCSPLOWO2_02_FULL_67_26]|nr:MAG: orotate phosphoribosyltransferase [Betaproteobacteria bacterium RIFCSPLOWO2_02_FULL_67_26]